VNGQAPLFERFALGNSRTLRGWNKYDVDPLGGERMAHGSVDYRFRWFRVIYDTGSAWRRGGPVRVRHSLALGLTHKGASGFSAMVAFPIREGSIDPIFITGINF
jgi:outer membrane protein assembly factor BamA